MGKEIKTILGIAFLFTLITSVFSLLGRLSLLFTSDDLKNGLTIFFIRSSLWIVTVAAIIFVLYRLSIKANLDIYDMLRDKTILTAAGIFVVIEGLLNLAGMLPVNFISIKSALEVSKQAGLEVNGIIEKTITANAISLVIMLCQIVFGIYMLRYRKNH